MYNVEYAYYITPDGVQYPLFGGNRVLMNIGRTGIPRIRYLKTRGPYQNGETVRDYRLNSRIIDISLNERGCNRQDSWDNAGNLNDIIRPNRADPIQPGFLLIILPDGTERKITAYIDEPPPQGWDYQGSISPYDTRNTMRFFSGENAYWRDPTIKTELFTVTPSDACLPLCLPFCLGSAIINTSVSITYPGTWLSYPTIKITGPIDQPEIKIQPSGDTIALNYNVSSGETVTIDLGESFTTVQNNFGDNLIGVVKDQNDLATFSIQVAPIVPGGINTITVTGVNGVAGETAITVSYYCNYLGVPK